ncbi:MAG: AraC family transcriptional regulator [Flavobacteriales bacterium]
MNPSIETLDMQHFAAPDSSFWMSKLENLLLDFPVLENHCTWNVFGLIFLEKGEGEITIDHRTIRADEPKIILIKPGQITSFDIARRSNGYLLCFNEQFFSLRYNNNILLSFSFMKSGDVVLQKLNDDVLSKMKIIFQFMSAEYHSNNAHRSKVLRSYLNIVLFEIEMNEHKLPGKHSNVKLHDKILEFEKLVNELFKTSKSPAYYAEKLCVSENYLNKLCKQNRKKTAGEIIRERIVLEAYRLLHHTNHTILQISDDLGFDSASYFITFFKKYSGITPEQFRRKNEN